MLQEMRCFYCRSNSIISAVKAVQLALCGIFCTYFTVLISTPNDNFKKNLFLVRIKNF